MARGANDDVKGTGTIFCETRSWLNSFCHIDAEIIRTFNTYNIPIKFDFNLRHDAVYRRILSAKIWILFEFWNLDLSTSTRSYYHYCIHHWAIWSSPIAQPSKLNFKYATPIVRELMKSRSFRVENFLRLFSSYQNQLIICCHHAIYNILHSLAIGKKFYVKKPKCSTN